MTTKSKTTTFFKAETSLSNPLSLEENFAIGNRQAVYHLARYVWLAAVLPLLAKDDPGRPVKVLDLSSDTGVGAAVLHEALVGVQPKVKVDYFGISPYPEAVEHAMAHYSSFGKFQLLDLDVDQLRPIPESHQNPDVVVCFDLLPKLAHRDVFLYNVGNLTAPIALSCPSFDGVSVTTFKPTEAKKVDYSRKALVDILRTNWGALLRPNDKSFPRSYVLRSIAKMTGYAVGQNLLWFSRKEAIKQAKRISPAA